MELLHGQSMARKVLLLQDCQSEVLVLTSYHLTQSWSRELKTALQSCATRGLRVRVLVEDGALAIPEVEIRQAPRRLSHFLPPFPVRSDLWIFDRSEAITGNERAFAGAASRETAPLLLECLLGEQAAHGLAGYFDRRWESEGRPLAFSVQHKNYAFHSGLRASDQFFACLLGAQREIVLCIPGGRVSRRVEQSLHAALGEGIRVGLFTNADRDDGPALRRLRRLSAAGAVVKICGRRLSSEAAVIDGQAVFVGALPSSWRWAPSSCPAFVMHEPNAARDLLKALELQVSVEISGAPLTTSLAW